MKISTKKMLCGLAVATVLLLSLEAKPIVSPFYKAPPGIPGYEESKPVADKFYNEFYIKGKKNKIAKLKNVDKHKLKITREALLKATSAQTTSLVAAAEAARSELAIAELAKKAQEISVKRAKWALQTIRTAAHAEEVAMTAIEQLFM